MGDVTEQAVLAVPRERAAWLAGVSTRRLDYWAATELVAPSIDRPLSPRNRVRLYGYQDLFQLLVVAELRQRGISLQYVRNIVGYLRDEGFGEPLTEIHFATDGGEVYFQLPDGTWYGGRRPREGVIHQVLRLDNIRARIARASQRDPSEIGQTERRRGRLGKKLVFAGTRIPVATVRAYLDHGFDDEAILEAFPDLTPQDIEAARTVA